MTDFDDIFDYITHALENVINHLPNHDDIMDHMRDAVHSIVDKINENGVEMDDTTKSLLVSELADAINADPGSIAANLENVSNVNFGTFSTETAGKVDPTSSFFKDGQLYFGDGCWNVCEKSSGEGSLRMKCGYHN